MTPERRELYKLYHIVITSLKFLDSWQCVVIDNSRVLTASQEEGGQLVVTGCCQPLYLGVATESYIWPGVTPALANQPYGSVVWTYQLTVSFLREVYKPCRRIREGQNHVVSVNALKVWSRTRKGAVGLAIACDKLATYEDHITIK
jgi:hypothetical protein